MNLPVAAIILAGGRSSRMGGGDKPLAELGADQTILDRMIARLAPQVAALAINANGDPARFAATLLEIVPDTMAGLPGPLAGILAGLEWAGARSTGHLLTVAGDSPFLPADLAERLAAAAGTGIAVAASVGKMHPVFALWPVRLGDPLRQHLSNGGSRRVSAFIEMHAFTTVDFPTIERGGRSVDPFFNINTPADLAEARTLVEDSGL